MNNKIEDPNKLGVYLDGAANTPVDERVAEAMEPYIGGFCGNSSSTHNYGQVADQAVEKAREQIAEAIGCKKDEVFFTSGATESNNWVVKGLALTELTKPIPERRMRVLCLSQEHSSVLAPCRSLQKLGFQVDFVDPVGNISSFWKFQEAIKNGKDDIMLVCCMAVNNETGQIFPAETIAKYALDVCGAPTLIDCTQALTEGGSSMRLRQKFPDAAFLSFSGHKIYGPTGVGCLIMNGSVAGGKFLGLPPLLDGGSQEAGHRGGTANTAAIVGLGEAVRLQSEESSSKKFCELFSELEEGIQGINRIVWTTMNGADHRNSVFLNKKNGVHHIANVNCGDFLDLPNLADALASRGVAVSAGSACAVTGDGTELSYVLESLGVDERGIRNSVRVSFTKYSTKDDVDEFIRILTGLILEFYSPRKRERSK